MYAILLPLHSLIRWLVLVTLTYGLYRGYNGWLNKKSFGKHDERTRFWTTTTAHIQLTIGLILYFVSPITDYFMHHFQEGVHQREIRFFGLEHSLMMIIGVTLITIGSAKSKHKENDLEKFKTMAIWFSIAMLILFLSIPWGFSPFTARPYYRIF